MGRADVHATLRVRAPIEFVFDQLVDHDAMNDWPDIASCRLIREGSPRNGLGAVREVKTRGLRLLEEVVEFDPPHRYDYSIIKGLPVEHRGTVTLTEEGQSVRVEWNVRMRSRWPLVCEIVGALLQRGLPNSLDHFKRETERALRSRPAPG